MNISAPFIRRPIGTTLLMVAVVLSGAISYRSLPVGSLPDIDFPTIQVSGALPGASPEIMASAVATPLEKQFSRIAGVTQMTSSSRLGTTSIALQFDLDRNIDAAARDVQAAINAASGQLPPYLPNLPTYRKVNPADSAILFFELISSTLPASRLYDVADSIVAQKLSQVKGVGQVNIQGGARPAVRIELNPAVLAGYGLSLEDVRNALGQVNANVPKGSLQNGAVRWVLSADDQLFDAKRYRPLIIAYRHGAPVRLGDIADVRNSVENIYASGLVNNKPAIIISIMRQPGANIVATVDAVLAALPAVRAAIPAAIESGGGTRPHNDDSGIGDGYQGNPADHCRARDSGDFCFFARSSINDHLVGRCAGIPGRNLWGDVPVRLFPRQSLLDGTHDRDRFCGGRRHRRDREHQPVHGIRTVTLPSCAQGFARDRIYSAFDEQLSHGRFHPYPPDGWNCRATVPRICRHALHRCWYVAFGFAFRNSGVMRQIPSTNQKGKTKLALSP